MTNEFRRSTFSIGLCATEQAGNLYDLTGVLAEEKFVNLDLKKIIIVASACSEKSLAPVRDLARRDSRIRLVEERIRHGKAEAINKIIQNTQEDFLVLVNSDALPEKGSIQKLLTILQNNRRVGIVSARPTFDSGRTVTQEVLRLMWTSHNECSLRLNHKGISNHCSDELVAVRSELLEELPKGIVNDGAYMAGRVFSQGYQIKFCPSALVRIDLPSRFVDLIRQRRRIIFGHFQIWRRIGHPPRTVESMLLQSPSLSLSIFVRSLARQPRQIRIIPVAILCEVASIILATWDTLRSTDRHVVWTRYGN